MRAIANVISAGLNGRLSSKMDNINKFNKLVNALRRIDAGAAQTLIDLREDLEASKACKFNLDKEDKMENSNHSAHSNPAHYLMCLFLWCETKQGAEYWGALHHDLKEMNLKWETV